jgi:hypothetical protein
MSRPTVSRSVCFDVKPPSVAQEQSFVTVRQLRVCWFGAPSLRRGQVYNCLWFSPVQSLSCPSSTGLMTIFYCLRFETRATWRARSRIYFPQEQGGPVIPPGTQFHFHRLLRLAGPRWRYLTPSARWVLSTSVGRSFRSVRLLLVFAITVIPGFSLLKIHDQDLCFFLEMYVFQNGVSSSTKALHLLHLSRWFSLNIITVLLLLLIYSLHSNG